MTHVKYIFANIFRIYKENIFQLYNFSSTICLKYVIYFKYILHIDLFRVRFDDTLIIWRNAFSAHYCFIQNITYWRYINLIFLSFNFPFMLFSLPLYILYFFAYRRREKCRRVKYYSKNWFITKFINILTKS